MGYAPVFDTVFDGTLCGKWPTLPVWLTLLPLADWRGHIDMTLQAIAARTGWPLDLLQKGIEELCQPDPDSRSPEEEGRRLVLLESHRSWGWRIVNFELYRRKVKDANDVATGRAAERSRQYRARHASSRLVTPRHDTHTHTHTEEIKSLVKPPSAFDRFWFLYPKKVKRKTAFDIWKRKRLDLIADSILADVPKRLESDGRWKDVKFIPDPTTYLNQERWQDEVTQSAPQFR